MSVFSAQQGPPHSLQPPIQLSSNGNLIHQSASTAESHAATAPSAVQRSSNANVQANPHVYMAVYSSVPVYEMMCRGIGVMRRRSDSWMNATQLLKVAGIEKSKRTKILERDIVNGGVHEKVQGGYGRFQGTWIPFHRAQALAEEYCIASLVAPILEYLPPPPSEQMAVPQVPRPTAPVGENGLEAPGRTLPVGNAAKGSPEGSDRKREREDASISPNASINKRLRVDDAVNGQAKPVGDLTITPTPKIDSSRSIRDDPVRQDQHRHILHSIFNDIGTDLNNLPSDLDPEVPLDEQKNVVLHWAAGLARFNILRHFVARGAAIERGNAQGETALMRAVQTINAHEIDAFPAMLEVLGRSLRLSDDIGRTALQHAAAVSGFRSRAASARYYVECILEYIARQQGGEFADVLEHEDKNGDTALNIAARAGNRAVMALLIDVGADTMHANKLGLRPVDFGVDGVKSEAATEGTTLKDGPPSSASRVSEVLSEISALVNSIGTAIHAEADARTHLDSKTTEDLRAAAAELAALRHQIADASKLTSNVDTVQQHIRNLEHALREEEAFDWTGRTEISGNSTGTETRQALAPVINSSEELLPTASTNAIDPSPPSDAVQLRRMVAWYRRVMGLLEQRIHKSPAVDPHLEVGYRKVIANSCRIPIERVDDMLGQLLAALESEQGADTNRLASLLTRVRAEGAQGV